MFVLFETAQGYAIFKVSIIAIITISKYNYCNPTNKIPDIIKQYCVVA